MLIVLCLFVPRIDPTCVVEINKIIPPMATIVNITNTVIKIILTDKPFSLL